MKKTAIEVIADLAEQLKEAAGGYAETLDQQIVDRFNSNPVQLKAHASDYGIAFFFKSALGLSAGAVDEMESDMIVSWPDLLEQSLLVAGHPQDRAELIAAVETFLEGLKNPAENDDEED